MSQLCLQMSQNGVGSSHRLAKLSIPNCRTRPILPVRNIVLTIIFASCVLACCRARAGVVQTVGAGSAVTSVDLSANFDSLVNREDLSSYTEGQLSITTPGTAFLGPVEINQVTANFDPFNGIGNGTPFFYAAEVPADGWVTIQTTDGRTMSGVEFLYGNGWPVLDTSDSDNAGLIGYGNSTANVNWQAFVGATLVSSGNTVVGVGTILGFSDPDGFDSLQVRATVDGGPSQAIALDNLNVQLAPVPEPSTWLAGALLLLPVGLQCHRSRHSRKQIV